MGTVQLLLPANQTPFVPPTRLPRIKTIRKNLDDTMIVMKKNLGLPIGFEFGSTGSFPKMREKFLWCSRGENPMANMLDCHIKVSSNSSHSCYYVHFQHHIFIWYQLFLTNPNEFLTNLYDSWMGPLQVQSLQVKLNLE